MGVATYSPRGYKITLDMLKDKNAQLKGKVPGVRVDKVDFKQEMTLVNGVGYLIVDILRGVFNNQYYITNVSALAKWQGFEEASKDLAAFKNYERDVREYHTAKPSFVLPKGTKVRIGSIEDAVVDEVLFDGLAYLIDYTEVRHNYGNPIRIPHQKKTWAWTEIQPETTNTKSMIKVDDNMRLNYSQRQLGGLISMIYDFGVDFEPAYQRGFVWNKTDKERLIDSIFHGVDIGKFVFVHLDSYAYGKAGYEILDGKQRLKTLQEFYENRFPYKGLYFKDLTTRDQHFIQDYSVSYAEVRNISDADKYRLFILLNTAGHVMEQKHLDTVKQMYAKETGHSFD